MLQRPRAAGNTRRTSRAVLARSESRRRSVRARSSCRHRARRSDIQHEPRRLEPRRGSPAGFEVHRLDAEMALAAIARRYPAARKKRSRARPAGMRSLSSVTVLPAFVPCRSAIRSPFLNFVCVGIHGVLPRVRVTVNRQAFVLFPALNGAYGGLQVIGDLLPGVESDAAGAVHDTDVTVSGSEPYVGQRLQARPRLAGRQWTTKCDMRRLAS